MKPLDLELIAIGLAGILMLYLLFGTSLIWNRHRFDGMSSEEAGKAAPFWLGLATVLSLAAIVFSIQALLVVQGILKTPRNPLFYAAGVVLIVVCYRLTRKR